MPLHSSAGESQDFHKVMVDASNMPVCVFDDRGNIVHVNEAWRSLLRDAPAPTMVQTMAEYLLGICSSVANESAEGAAFIAEGIRSVMRGEREVFNFKYSAQTAGEIRSLEGVARPIEIDGSNMVVVSFHNVTAQSKPT